MRLYCLFVLLITPLFLRCQIVIGETDLPNAGDSFTTSTADLFNDYDYPAAGEDFIWDFSGLESTGQNQVDFVSVSEAPFAYQFLFNNPFAPEHLADMAIETEGFGIEGTLTMEDVFAFYQKSDTSYRIVGYGATINSIPLPSYTEPIDEVYNLPLNYGDTSENYSEWLVNVPTLATYKLKQWRDYEVDGWGTLHLPFGTFEALRVRMEIEATDSIVIDLLGLDFEIDRSSVEYHWLGVNSGIPLLHVIETFGLTSSVIYQDEPIDDPVSISEEQNVFQVFPNPASDRIYWTADFIPSNLQIVDRLGKKVKEEPTSGYSGEVNVEQLAKGVYQIVLLSANEFRMQTFIIQ